MADSQTPVAHKPVVTKGRPPVRRPDLDTVFSINEDGSRNAIHPADVHGRYQRRKDLLWVLLIGVYLAMPWVRIGGKPAILIDIASRHFYLLGQTFNAQDFRLAFFFVTGLGFALFVVAALFGRVWCGYACPQTVFLEGVFRRVERWIEGSAPARAKLDRAPLRQKLWRRGSKLAIYLAVSLVITHSFLGYFMPVEEVVAAVTTSPAAHPTAFVFVVVTTLLVFVNFTWFREQLCIVVCPYGRLQGTLYDPDTVLVGYDRSRGEPRGPAGTEGAGDCVDCYRCVSVCPTGIDIRNGTQLECVGCANCIDACDDVMQKLGRERGLVRYDSQRGFETGTRRFARPRVFLYSFLLLLGATVMTISMGFRRPFEANLIRTAGPAFAVDGDVVRNTFQLHVVNKLPDRQRFIVEAIAPADARVVLARPEVELDSLQDAHIDVVVLLPRVGFRPGTPVELRVRTERENQPVDVVASAPLAGPKAFR